MTAHNHASELIARDRHRLLGSVGATLFGQGAAFAAGLLCMVLTVRLLGPEGYGRLAMFFLLLAVLSQVLSNWPNLGLVRFGRQELGETARMGEAFWARLLLYAASLALSALLLWLFRRRLEEYLNLAFAPALLLLLYLAANELVFLLRGVFQTLSRFRAYALSLFLIRAFILLLLAGAFLALRRQATPAAVLQLHIVAVSAVALICMALLPWRQLLPLRVNPRTVKALAGYSWPLMLGGLSHLVVDWVDLAVLRTMLPKAQAETAVGLYAVAYQPVIVLTHLRTAFIAAVLPLAMSMAVERRHESLIWCVDDALPQFAWGVGLALTLAAGAAEAIPLVMGAQYAGSVTPCQLLMPGVAISIFSATQAALAQALDRVRAASAVVIVLAALNVALDVALVPRYGMIGAAAATSAAFLLSGLLYFPLLNRIPQVRGERPARRYAALVAFLPSIAFAVLAVRLPNAPARLIACAGLCAAGLLAARFLGVFRIATMDRLQQVHMPAPVRGALHGFYRVFGR